MYRCARIGPLSVPSSIQKSVEAILAALVEQHAAVQR